MLLDFLRKVVKCPWHLYKGKIEPQLVRMFYCLCRLLPLQNRVVASTFKGRKIGDNPQFIIDELLKINNDIDIVWVINEDYVHGLPENIRTISSWSTPWKKVYEYATAKVWLNTHKWDMELRKRKNQIAINTWHGGLGIKKIDNDVPKFKNDPKLFREIEFTSKITDIFISNSDFLSNIFRRAFGYKGTIKKLGFPRNDILVNNDNSESVRFIRDKFKINKNVKILFYAPTFRDSFWGGKLDMSVYNIDFKKVCDVLKKKTGYEWVVLIKFHPFLIQQEEIKNFHNDNVIDVTNFQDMQGLLLSCDAFITDYSSCFFDVALRNIPCFTFAIDFDEYKSDRGVYYNMTELPFPYAKNNDELFENIKNFDLDKYLCNWNNFKVATGLYETGHASKDVAKLINSFLFDKY